LTIVKAETGEELVCVIVVNWNGWRDTLECLESCARLDYPRVEIVVIDNGSTDDSVARLRERFPSLHLIETGANLGFAAGNNAGLPVARRLGAAYVWLLNNDTVVDPASLSALVDALRDDDDIAIAGSKICHQDEPGTLWYAGGFLSSFWGWAVHRGSGEPDDGRYDQTADVDFATGCSLLVRTAVLDEIGPLADEYFLYWEDVDLCARARQAGGRVVYVPASRVLHKLGSSLPPARRRVKWRYEGRNRLLFYRRQRPSRLPWITLSSLLNALYLVVRGRPGDALALLHGMADAARGRTGEICG
jgi:GT2 family glycosyltransferase